MTAEPTVPLARNPKKRKRNESNDNDNDNDHDNDQEDAADKPESDDDADADADLAVDDAADNGDDDKTTESVARIDEKRGGVEVEKVVDDRGLRLRLPLQPCDMILFVHLQSRRVLEAIVTDVEERRAWVTTDIPLPRSDNKTDKNRHPHKVLNFRLDLYAVNKEYELLGLFRPATGFRHGPVGSRLLPGPPDVWLQVNDEINIIKQGSVVSNVNDSIVPDTFVAKVVSVNAVSCRISPTNRKTHRPTISNHGNNSSSSSSSSSSNSSISGSRGGEELENLVTASGQVSEMVGRNTLRFRGYVKQSDLANQSIVLKLAPASKPLSP